MTFDEFEPPERPIVCDASVALAIILRERRFERVEPAVVSAGVWGRLIAPAGWTGEVLNGLWMAERRRRIPVDEFPGRVAAMASLRVRVVGPAPEAEWLPWLCFAEASLLTVYDASYLSLALQENAVLATFDQQLGEEAVKHGVGLLTPLTAD